MALRPQTSKSLLQLELLEGESLLSLSTKTGKSFLKTKLLTRKRLRPALNLSRSLELPELVQ